MRSSSRVETNTLHHVSLNITCRFTYEGNILRPSLSKTVQGGLLSDEIGQKRVASLVCKSSIQV